MSLQVIANQPKPDLAFALAGFEQQFSYPFGTACSFRIEHGADYAQFYRSIGDARCFVAQSNSNAVLGVLSAALRPLLSPNGDEYPVCYLGDLKVAPGTRAGRFLVQSQRAIREWLPHPEIKAFGVVMDGARALPSNYSGRAGIPAFTAVSNIVILRINCESPTHNQQRFSSTETETRKCYRRFSMGRYASPVGKPSVRSLMTPVWLATPDNTACGCLEDTRMAKRLVINDGSEMINAHLSAFAFSNAQDGAILIQEACSRAAQLNYPALLVAIAESDAPMLKSLLDRQVLTCAPATIYAHNITPGPLWNVNSSEI